VTPKQERKAKMERVMLLRERIRNTPPLSNDEKSICQVCGCSTEPGETYWCKTCSDQIEKVAKLEALEAEIARKENDYADDDDLPQLAEERDLLKAQFESELGDTYGRVQTI